MYLARDNASQAPCLSSLPFAACTSPVNPGLGGGGLCPCCCVTGVEGAVLGGGSGGMRGGILIWRWWLDNYMLSKN
jgi:hypothetical protein